MKVTTAHLFYIFVIQTSLTEMMFNPQSAKQNL